MGFKGKNIFGAQINRSFKAGSKIADVFTKFALLGGIWGISKLGKKEKVFNYAKHNEIIRKANLAEIANKSEDKRLLKEFIDRETVNNNCQFIHKIKMRLLNTLTLYYKNPTSSNLFNSMQTILEEKKDSAIKEYVKKECTACIEVLNLLKQYKDVDEVIIRIKSKYVTERTTKYNFTEKGNSVSTVKESLYLTPIEKSKVINNTSQSNEKQLLDEFSKRIQGNNPNPNCLILYTSATRIYTALITFYKQPQSSNLFYELTLILQDKISSVKTENIKKECRIAIEILNLLKEYQNADKVIKHIEDKYSN